MIWVALRRQRLQLITLLVLLVVGSAAVLIMRPMMLADLHSMGLEGCLTTGLEGCGKPKAPFQLAWYTPMRAAQLGLLVLPLLIGLFIGVPLLAREIEQGTHVLAFTQSVSRTRWMLTNIAVGLLPALVLVLAGQSLINWWLSAAGDLGPLRVGPFDMNVFGIQHIAPVVYTLFAFSLGLFTGVLARRLLTGMLITLVGFVVLRVALETLRFKLISPERKITGLPDTAGVYGEVKQIRVDSGYLDAQGHVVPDEVASAASTQCKATSVDNTQFFPCMEQKGMAKHFTDMITEPMAGQLHLVEGAIFLGVTALLFAATLILVRRRT
ncbi:hypothetical protein D5S17_01030 [Pseudonocardiaceae bacterium YIM PH 21723]|nr:hypothetical protein D5S17_01030 [Pseudonocardiaceae bacterium YIM PH 21723]